MFLEVKVTMRGCLELMARFGGICVIVVITVIVIAQCSAEDDENRRIQYEMNKRYEELNRR